jgi:hypothetical protein
MLAADPDRVGGSVSWFIPSGEPMYTETRRHVLARPISAGDGYWIVSASFGDPVALGPDDFAIVDHGDAEAGDFVEFDQLFEVQLQRRFGAA